MGCNILIGTDFGNKNGEMIKRYEAWQAGSGVVLELNLPFTTFGKSLQARAELLDVFRQRIVSNAGTEQRTRQNVSDILRGESLDLSIDVIADTMLVFLSAGKWYAKWWIPCSNKFPL